ncbi:Rid family hydrolase [Brucella intermedia]|uniref:Rid family hydrolase n=1 Tax=Brucella intermedia TaxID=94625 RepID=UPI002B056FD8|nr:Rid family hydrolase [Brucella intermedia]
MIEKVRTKCTPFAVGPCSQGIKAGSLFFVSGQIATDPTTREFNLNDPVKQVDQCLRNI